MFCALQALRDKEFSLFEETTKQARYGRHLDTREISNFNSNLHLHWQNNLPVYVLVCFHRGAEVDELCRGSLEAVSSLYPALRNLQSIRELESVKQLFSR